MWRNNLGIQAIWSLPFPTGRIAAGHLAERMPSALREGSLCCSFPLSERVGLRGIRLSALPASRNSEVGLLSSPR